MILKQQRLHHLVTVPMTVSVEADARTLASKRWVRSQTKLRTAADWKGRVASLAQQQLTGGPLSALKSVLALLPIRVAPMQRFC